MNFSDTQHRNGNGDHRVIRDTHTPRKIALLNDSFPPQIDGVANAVLNYAQWLSRTDDVTVITPQNPEARDRYGFKVDRYFSLPGSKRLGYRIGVPLAPENIKYFLAKNRFDIIHVHSPFASGLLARMMRTDQSVLITTYHTKFEEDFEKRLKTYVMKEIAMRFVLDNLNACDEVWTVSEGASESLHAMGYMGRYLVMPNGVDLPAGRASEAAIREAEQSFHIRPGLPLILYVGRMMWYKNIRLILDACLILKQRKLPFQAVFVGDGIDRQEMIEYTHKIGLLGGHEGDTTGGPWGLVSFPGAVQNRKQLCTLYSRADVFAFPSSYDTSGLVVREAAACACPSVLVANTCAAEGVVDGHNGFLAKAETAEAVAEQLIRILTDLNLAKQVGVHAQNELYISWEHAVRRASRRYDRLLKQKRACRKSAVEK